MRFVSFFNQAFLDIVIVQCSAGFKFNTGFADMLQP